MFLLYPFKYCVFGLWISDIHKILTVEYDKSDGERRECLGRGLQHQKQVLGSIHNANKDNTTDGHPCSSKHVLLIWTSASLVLFRMLSIVSRQRFASFILYKLRYIISKSANAFKCLGDSVNVWVEDFSIKNRS
jgi:hypothetical protein